MSLMEKKSEFLKRVTAHYQDLHVKSPESLTIDTLYWFYEVFAGNIEVGAVFDGLFIRIAPCTQEFATKLDIRSRLPLFARILYEEENAYIETLPAVEIRIKHESFNYGYVVVAYKEMMLENRTKSK